MVIPLFLSSYILEFFCKQVGFGVILSLMYIELGQVFLALLEMLSQGPNQGQTRMQRQKQHID